MANDFNQDDSYQPDPPDPVARPWLAREHALRQEAEVARDRWRRYRLPVVEVMPDGVPVLGGSGDQIEELGRLSREMDEADATWKQFVEDWRAAGMLD